MRIWLHNTDFSPDQDILLAKNAAAAGSDCGPAEAVEVDTETTIQESKPIGSLRRKLFPRNNAGGRLSFTVRARYGSLAAAAQGAWTIGRRAGLEGALGVRPAPETAEEGNVAGNPGDGTTPYAIVRAVKTRQIGVTVEARYEIEFR